MTLQNHHWLLALTLAILCHLIVLVLFYPPAVNVEGDAKAVGVTELEITLGSTSSLLSQPEKIIEVKAKQAMPKAPVPQVEQTQVVKIPTPVVAKQESAAEARPIPEIISVPAVAMADVVVTEIQPLPLDEPLQNDPKHVIQLEEVASPQVSDITPPPSRKEQMVNEKRGVESQPAEPNIPAINNPGEIAGGIPGAQETYMAQLIAWLEKHKKYPRNAQRRRQEGTATLAFVIGRSGEVLSYELQQSSGFRLLDKEVERIIERARPMPAMPDVMTLSQLEVVVPFSFYLR